MPKNPEIHNPFCGQENLKPLSGRGEAYPVPAGNGGSSASRAANSNAGGNAAASPRPAPANVYFQTTEFTCGPATLMMAMAALDPSYKPNRLDELKIWRESNMVFMGEGHAGCNQYGLAVAALARGYEVDIYEFNADQLFTSLAKSPAEAEAQTLLEQHDRSKALKRGARIHNQRATPELLSGLLAEGRQIITLTSEDEHGHWCNVHDVASGRIFVIDPYNEPPEQKELFEPSQQEFVYHADFNEWAGFGDEEITMMISIGPRKSETVQKFPGK